MNNGSVVIEEKPEIDFWAIFKVSALIALAFEFGPLTGGATALITLVLFFFCGNIIRILTVIGVFFVVGVPAIIASAIVYTIAYVIKHWNDGEQLSDHKKVIDAEWTDVH